MNNEIMNTFEEETKYAKIKGMIDTLRWDE